MQSAIASRATLRRDSAYLMGRRTLALLAVAWPDENLQADCDRRAGLDVAFLVASMIAQ